MNFAAPTWSSKYHSFLIMADELRDSNIKVNAECPGWVNTDIGGNMAPTNSQTAAREIVHFALVDAAGPTDSKKQFSGKKLVLL
ncbi:MAG TPA: hypothetical protein VJ772_10290 [Nitrososphaeraceae archaeon]|nr:hypothetical protein [Nitrososphaeraceae archaeon]